MLVTQDGGGTWQGTKVDAKDQNALFSVLLNGKAGLSGNMALRMEKAFGVKMDTLMRMQSSYDIAQTRKREKEIRVRRVRRTADVYS